MIETYESTAIELVVGNLMTLKPPKVCVDRFNSRHNSVKTMAKKHAKKNPTRFGIDWAHCEVFSSPYMTPCILEDY